jgi:hypothetical protein
MWVVGVPSVRGVTPEQFERDTGEVFTTPSLQYVIRQLAAGRYQFVCDVHPQPEDRLP